MECRDVSIASHVSFTYLINLLGRFCFNNQIVAFCYTSIQTDHANVHHDSESIDTQSLVYNQCHKN